MIDRATPITTAERPSVTWRSSSVSPRAFHENERAASTPVAIESCGALASVRFFLAYMVLHALHLAARDPAFMYRLSAIPLFATFWGSALFGAAPGALSSLLLRGKLALRPWLPWLVGVAALLFSLEIALFP